MIANAVILSLSRSLYLLFSRKAAISHYKIVLSLKQVKTEDPSGANCAPMSSLFSAESRRIREKSIVFHRMHISLEYESHMLLS